MPGAAHRSIARMLKLIRQRAPLRWAKRRTLTVVAILAVPALAAVAVLAWYETHGGAEMVHRIVTACVVACMLVTGWSYRCLLISERNAAERAAHAAESTRETAPREPLYGVITGHPSLRGGTRVEAYNDVHAARIAARGHNGVVVQLPILHDYRRSVEDRI